MQDKEHSIYTTPLQQPLLRTHTIPDKPVHANVFSTSLGSKQRKRKSRPFIHHRNNHHSPLSGHLQRGALEYLEKFKFIKL